MHFYKMQPEQLSEIFEANKDAWNKRTGVHKDSAFYDVASFKAGKTSLNKIDLDEVGDVKGKNAFAPAMPLRNGYNKLGKRRRNRYRDGSF